MKVYSNIHLVLLLLLISDIAISSEKFGMYEDSQWGVGISHKTSGFAMGECSQGFYLEIPKGGGTIDLDLSLEFIGNDPSNKYTGRIETTLSGTTGGRSIEEYVESPELCFDIKEVVIIKAIGAVNGKQRDLIKEKKIFESGFIPLRIKVGENG